MLPHGFKVIIVGCGLTGLVAAHALRAAGINFIILEQRSDILVDEGGLIALAPEVLRICHQLDLWEKMQEIGFEYFARSAYNMNGDHQDSESFKYIRNNAGTTVWGFHRAELMKLMYDSLGEDKNKLLLGMKLAEIVPLGNGVKAICKDGKSFVGDIVLGTDGVRSTVRTLMIDLARKADPGDAVWAGEKPYPAYYRAAFFYSPPVGPSGMLCETNQKDKAAFHFTSPERSYVVAMEKLPDPTTEVYQYSAQETDDMVKQFDEFPVMEGFKVKDVYTRKTQPAVILNIQEGIAAKWSWGGRIVLAGDSCHKLTPNTGSGCNCATQDVAVLVNGLHQMLSTEKDTANISSERLAQVFETYQAARYDLAKTQTSMSGTVLRLQLWANPIYYFVHNVLMKTWLFDYLLWNILTPREMKRGVVLDYVRAEEPFQGDMEWDHKIK